MATVEEPAKPDTPKKSKSRAKEKHEGVRFQGSGTNFRAKLIGVEAVGEARGDKMCQETMHKLKGAAKSSGGHKQRVTINVSLEGLKIVDDKSGKLIHHHPVHRISFIARDTSDSRAFGYIYSPGDGRHKFFGIKTEKAAESLVLSLRDLFQVVFEMKKKEVEEAKRQKEENKENLAKEETYDRESINSRDSRSQEDTPRVLDTVGNLLHLEVELQTIEQGLQQISAFGTEQWGVVPGSPGGWSAGSDSWGTPSTPRSLNQAATDVSLSSSSQSQLTSQQSVVSAGGGFPTLPHPSHSMAFSIQPPSCHSGLTQTIPTLPKPSASMRSTTSLRRPTSVQNKTAGSTPPIKHTSWATFDSPSPPDAPPTANVSQPVFPTQDIPDESTGWPANEVKVTEVSTLPVPPPKAAGQSFGGISGIEDPFKNDPFFSSTPAGDSNDTSQVKDNKYSVFSDLGQPSFSAEDTSTVQGSTCNSSEDSSVFTHQTEPVSPAQDHSALNAAFASTPIQVPVTGLAHQSSAIETSIANTQQVQASNDDKHNNSGDSASIEPPNSEELSAAQNSASETSRTNAVKPTLLQLCHQVAAKPKAQAQSCLELTAPNDPFGDPVSPATEAKLNTSAGNSDDPFDTSSILRSLAKGPYDVSQLKPVSLGMSVVPSQLEESPEKPVPLPSVPPPPLPSSSVVDLGMAPTPPPRPAPTATTKPDARMASIKKQMTFDTSDMAPPPVPRRPPVTNNSSKLVRQATVQFPLEPAEPPPPPPRPGVQTTSSSVRSQEDGDKPFFDPSFSVPRPGSTSTPGTVHRSAVVDKSSSQQISDPFAVVLHQSKSKSTRSSISPIERARPRPRAKTPANTSSGFGLAGSNVSNEVERPSSAAELTGLPSDRSSFGKGQLSVFGAKTVTHPEQPSRALPSVGTVTPVIDPFAGVDPFTEEGCTDPFSDMPDPFESPMDPFSKNFTGELFVTKAVTLSTSENPRDPPPSDMDPFKDDPFAKDPFESSSFSTLAGHTSNDKFADTTLRTDTSLEASVSLPVCSNSVDTSAVQIAGSTVPPSSSQTTFSEPQATNRSDPFQFDIFSNDFFKGQVNGSGFNSSVTNNSNSSWAFNCTTNDLITNKAGSGWNSSTKTTQGNPSALQSSNNISERTSPNLHPYSIPPARDNDSSSNSEIADAFCDDPSAPTFTAQTGDLQTAAVVGNPFL